MLNRRTWLQSALALSISSKLRLWGISSTGQKVASDLVTVPEWEALSAKNREQPVVAVAEGISVKGFGSVDILSVCPDLIRGEVLQKGNASPAQKLRLKKSWETRGNKIGATPPRTPRTWMMDFKPLRAVHLIDGNPSTYWCSRGQTQPDVEPEWIRIDLATEAVVNRIVLVPRADMGGWPGSLEIRVSRDAHHWETVFKEHEIGALEKGNEKVFSFSARPVKQIWIEANQLRWAIAESFIVFSLAGVKVFDEAGEDLALITRGAGVTVSSTNQGAAGEKQMHDMLWPAHYDLGLNWVRVSYWDSVFNWHYAEQENGKIVIDPLADETVTESTGNGIHFVLCLAYGNWLYSKEAKAHASLDALPPYSTADKQLWTVPFHWPPPPSDSEEHFAAWLNFVRTMVRHFKGRIRYYEIWNEQNLNWAEYYKEKADQEKYVDQYCRLVKSTAMVIREEFPEARIMLGSVGHFDREYMLACLQRGLGPLVDVIPWHPFYGTRQDSPEYRGYRRDVRAFKAECESHGFKGEYMATESGWYAPYPVPTKPFGGGAVSEIVKAKCLARYISMSVGLDLTTFWNTTWHHYTWWDLGLFRNSFSADPISPTQPQAAYYVLRNLCTVLDGVKPSTAPVQVDAGSAEVDCDTFELPDGSLLAAVYLSEEPVDHSREVNATVRFPGSHASHATGINILNGTEQPIAATNGELRDVIVRDYPAFFRVELK
jgi:hypothetical protein